MDQRKVTLEDVAKLRTIALGATQGPWIYGATPCPDKTTAMAIFEASLDRTKEPSDYFYEVCVEDGRRTAIVGNGPTSNQNGLYIATFDPLNVLMLLDTLEELLVMTT